MSGANASAAARSNQVTQSTPSNASLSNSPTLSLMATNAGVILGTAAYMSPEQARGENTDQRTDIFAFGCVLYEMLTGRQAFQGKTVSDILASVLAREPDFSLLHRTSIHGSGSFCCEPSRKIGLKSSTPVSAPMPIDFR